MVSAMGGKTRSMNIEIDLDQEKLQADLTRLYTKKCDTKKPKSNGVCFLDVYVNENWEVGEKSP